MPSRPSAARRRFHTERVIANRLALLRARHPWYDPGWMIPGPLADWQQYLGCKRARCIHCCDYKNLPNGDRQREEREWRRHESAASGEDFSG